MTKIQEIESFEYPSRLKGYKPRKKKDYTLLKFAVFIACVMAACGVLNVVVDALMKNAGLIPEAHAQTIELKHCRTNLECIALYCAGGHGYVREEKLDKLCV